LNKKIKFNKYIGIIFVSISLLPNDKDGDGVGNSLKLIIEVYACVALLYKQFLIYKDFLI